MLKRFQQKEHKNDAIVLMIKPRMRDIFVTHTVRDTCDTHNVRDIVATRAAHAIVALWWPSPWLYNLREGF